MKKVKNPLKKAVKKISKKQEQKEWKESVKRFFDSLR